MKILIFDTSAGLCNQIWCIQATVHFCNTFNIKFAFRYANFREGTYGFLKVPFNKLFSNKSFINNINYIKFRNIKDDITDINSIDLSLIREHNDKYIDDILYNYQNVDKKYFIVGNAFWTYYKFKDDNILKYLVPPKTIMNIYKKVKKDIGNRKYNIIHYRYEDDMKSYVNSLNKEFYKPKLDILLKKKLFKNNKLCTYICSHNVENFYKFGLIEKPLNKYNIIWKNIKECSELNYEENAFIDFLIAKDCKEFYGFSNSSFSQVINNLKNTDNYYDK